MKTGSATGGVAAVGKPGTATNSKGGNWWQSPFCSGLLDERHRFDAGDVEGAAAVEILAGGLVVEEDHVALRLGELGAVPIIGAGRQAILLFAHHPPELVGFRAAAI